VPEMAGTKHSHFRHACLSLYLLSGRQSVLIMFTSLGAAGTYMASSVALGLNFIKGQCGLVHRKKPGIGGGGCEGVGEVILQI